MGRNGYRSVLYLQGPAFRPHPLNPDVIVIIGGIPGQDSGLDLLGHFDAKSLEIKGQWLVIVGILVGYRINEALAILVGCENHIQHSDGPVTVDKFLNILLRWHHIRQKQVGIHLQGVIDAAFDNALRINE